MIDIENVKVALYRLSTSLDSGGVYRQYNSSREPFDEDIATINEAIEELEEEKKQHQYDNNYMNKVVKDLTEKIKKQEDFMLSKPFAVGDLVAIIGFSKNYTSRFVIFKINKRENTAWCIPAREQFLPQNAEKYHFKQIEKILLNRE